jgi:LacI family transcriptional regulator
LPKRPQPVHGAIRLRDIAERAGVSINTVSRALNAKPDVNAETRAAVVAIARALGYTPNLLARSLLRGRSHSVGLVVTDCTDPFYAALIHAAEAVLSSSGFGLLLATSNESTDKERRALSMLRERRTDGLLLTPVDVDAAHVRQLLRGDLPVVLLGRRPAGYGGAFVGTDNVAGVRALVRHLVQLGHRGIAHVTREDRASSAAERLEGYRHGLAEAGLAFDARRLVVRAPPTVAGGGFAAASVLAMEPRPTAVIAYNDAQAVGLMLALADADIDVPGAMSVAGFDGIELGALVRPRLTTIAQPIDEIGTRGAGMLIDLIHARDGARSVLLPPALIAGQSTARAPATGAVRGLSRRPAAISARAARAGRA